MQRHLAHRSQRDPQEIVQALQHSMRSLDPALPLEITTWHNELNSALSAARVATVSLGVAWPAGRDACHYRHLRHGRLHRQQTPSRTRYPHSPRSWSTRTARGRARTYFPAARHWIDRWHDPRCTGNPRPLVHRVSGHTKRPGHPRRRHSYHTLRRVPQPPWFPPGAPLPSDPMILLREE
jgi:hypothetical protein